MWESRAFCEIPKESWKEGESCLWIPTLSTLRHFHSSVFTRCHAPSRASPDNRFARGGCSPAAAAGAAASTWFPPSVSPAALRFLRSGHGHRSEKGNCPSLPLQLIHPRPNFCVMMDFFHLLEDGVHFPGGDGDPAGRWSLDRSPGSASFPARLIIWRGIQVEFRKSFFR